MGFYNIFRMVRLLLKDIFGSRNFRNILIAILIIFTIFLFDSKVFASNDFAITYTSNRNTKTITVAPELLNYDYIFLYASCANNNSQGEIYFIATNKAPSNFIYSDYFNTYTIRFNFTSGDERYIYSGIGNQSGVSSNLILNTNTTVLQNTQATYNLTINILNTNYNYGYSVNYSYMSTFDVIANNQTIFGANYSTYVNPSLNNTQSDLENLSFNNFIINTNSFTETMSNNSDEPLVMLFYNRSLSNSNNTDGLYPIKEKLFYKESIYYDSTNSTDTNYIFNYPIFKSGVFFNVGSTYEIKFARRVYNNDGTWQYNYFDNNYVFTISSNVTQDYINQLNQQTATSTDEDGQKELENAINNQTQSIDNINNTINDSNVDNSSIDLPTDNTNDITQGNIDNIFQTIYNSFTSGTPQDIVFPIPFTNRNITLSPNYIYNSLNSNGASWVINIIQAFWWYIISRFIIKDIMSKIRKIKQGNFDNIQNSNIREDML